MSEYEYNHINDVIEDLYEKGNLAEDDYDFLCAIVDRVDIYDKHKWHDLRKNPDDLPTDIPVYVCYLDFRENKGYELAWSYDGVWDDYIGDRIPNVIAWKYVEPFEEGDT